jgi:putative oxidoreductase
MKVRGSSAARSTATEDAGAGIYARFSPPLLLLARLCLAFEFVLFGTRKFLHPDNIASVMSAHGVPGSLIWLVIPLQLIGGSLAAIGLQTRIVSLALCGFCILAPSIFQTHSLDNWSRDIASAGGWLLLALLGPGRWALDARLGVGSANFPRIPQEAAPKLMALARLLIAVHFLSCGVRDLLVENPSSAQLGYAPLAMPLATLQILAGAMILVGWHTRVACAVMAAYVFARASTVHSPAAELGLFREGGSLALLIHGLFHNMGGLISSYGKDLAVFGALLTLYVYGPGPMRWRVPFRRGHAGDQRPGHVPGDGR